MSVPFSMIGLVVAAAAVNPWLQSAKASYEKLECDRVLVDLESARQVPTNDLPTQLAILDFTGRCQIALGHRPEAEAAFAQMLALDPQAELDPALSPKIRDAFKATKLRLYPADYLALKELPGSDGLVRAELIDPWKRAAQVVVGRWIPAAQRFEEAPVIPEGKVYLVRLTPGDAWFLEARTATGEALALLGKKTPPVLAVAAAPTPAAIEAAPPAVREATKPRTVARWVSVSAGALAVVVGIALWGLAATTRASADQATWADDTVTLDVRAASQGNWGTGFFLGGVAVGVTGFALTW